MNRTVFSLPEQSEYRTRGGLGVSRAVEHFSGHADRLDYLIDLLDRRPGVVLSSGTTVPGRYESFDLGFSDPPLRLETTGLQFSIEALNSRGEVLISFLGDTLGEPCVVIDEKTATRLAGHILRGEAPVDEDQRTRRASVMSLVRDLVAVLGSSADALLGLFGAFAYDLVFQMEDLKQKRARASDQRDIVLYVPDRLLAYDRATGRGVILSYDFAWNEKSTKGLPRDTEQIRQLLNSEKDEFELNMCTDVDRNDKARVCVPGTIKVLARRQIETYSKLFHTVDHVEGVLRPGFDSLDAFLTHAWAVTVTGAPKLWAMQFV